MFGIGHFWELLMVVAIALLVFGPKRLPEMGNAVGKTIKEFQKSMKEITTHDDSAAAPRLPAPVTVERAHSDTVLH